MHVVFAGVELPQGHLPNAVGEATFALAKALRAMGHRVTMVMPKYPNHDLDPFILAKRLYPVTISTREANASLVVYDSRTTSGIDIVWIEDPLLFASPHSFRAKDGFPTPIGTSIEAFGSAVVEILRHLEPRCDVLHLHGFEAEHAIALLERERTPLIVQTLYTTHRSGISESTAAALRRVDRIVVERSEDSLDASTDAPRHRTSEQPESESVAERDGWSDAFRPLLRQHASKLSHIPSGIDASVWSPATDPWIASRFDPVDMSGKEACKTTLQHETALPIALDVPIIAALLLDHHAEHIPAVMAALKQALRNDCQVVLAAESDGLMTDEFTALQSAWPDRLALHPISEGRVLHKLLSGADFAWILPSHDPRQSVDSAFRSAQRYGCVPIAPAPSAPTSQLVDCDPELESGNAILHDQLPGAGAALQRACAVFGHTRFASLQQRIMRIDQSWDRSARLYGYLYDSLLTARAVTPDEI